MFNALKFSIFLLLALVLNGCSLTPKQNAMSCPQVGVVDDLSNTKLYASGKQHHNDGLIAQATIADFKGKCHYSRKGVDIDFDMTILAEKGAKANRDKVSFSYFVAITDENRNILKKEIYATDIDFPQGVTKAGSVESLSQFLPLAKNQSAARYEVLIGFQPEQIAKR